MYWKVISKVMLMVSIGTMPLVASDRSKEADEKVRYVQFDAKTKELIKQWLYDRYLSEQDFTPQKVRLVGSETPSMPHLYMRVSQEHLKLRDQLFKRAYVEQGLQWGAGCGLLFGAACDYYNVGRFSEPIMQRPQWYTWMGAVGGGFLGWGVGKLRHICAKRYRDQGITFYVEAESAQNYVHLHGLRALLLSHHVQLASAAADAGEVFEVRTQDIFSALIPPNQPLVLRPSVAE